MPLPLLGVPALYAMIVAAVSKLTFTGVVTGGVAAAAAYDAVEEWLTTDDFASILTDKLNAKLAAAGLELQFTNVTDTDAVRATVEGFALERINAKAGTQISSLAGLNRENFLEAVGSGIAAKINAQTGANLTSVYPVDKLIPKLQTEVIRQFDNRGRYGGGRLFKGDTLDKIRTKIAAKNPALMAQVKATRAGGYWGAAIDEKHQRRRDKGRDRQARYKTTHQQVWVTKGN